jgi:hypothetical protein
MVAIYTLNPIFECLAAALAVVLNEQESVREHCDHRCGIQVVPLPKRDRALHSWHHATPLRERFE